MDDHTLKMMLAETDMKIADLEKRLEFAYHIKDLLIEALTKGGE